MARVVVNRLLQAIATLLLASVLVFILARSSGNPADLVLSSDATPAERTAYITRMGLDRPLPVQYAAFLGAALQGDFGKSLRTGAPAADIVFSRLDRTLRLATAGLAIALAISLPLGVVAAVRRGGAWDRLGMGFALLGQSVPAFWLGIVMILVLSVWLRWLPTSGVGTWKHYVMPSIVLGWSISAGIVRLLRSSMIEVLGSEFVKLARAKGLSEAKVVWKHAFRNALIPVVTFVGFMYGIIIASGIVIEVVFGWPGLGYLAYESTLWRDFPVLQLAVLVYTALVIVINFLVDLSYGLIDPRVRG
jgi:peptide/nickel transport system permease protein